MYKIILLLLITIFSYSKTIHFKEQRYINALNNSIYKKGFINFSQNSIKMWYEKSNEKLIFKDSTVFIQKQKQLIKNNNIASNIYFTILKSIFYNDKNILNSFFNIKKNNTLTILIPKNEISNYLEKVEYKKYNGKLDYLKIFLINKDRIIIEQTN